MTKMTYKGEYDTAQNATYVCNSCGNAEGMGPDDPRHNLNTFTFNAESEEMVCRECSSLDVYCEFESDECEDQKFKIEVAMDVRAYGYVEVEAETVEKAVEWIDDVLIADNFQPHGSSDDLDYSTPVNIVAMRCDDEEGETLWDDYMEVPSRWTPKPSIGEIPGPTCFSVEESLETVWSALREFDNHCLPVSDASTRIWDDICTAMAWIEEAVNGDQDQGNEVKGRVTVWTVSYDTDAGTSSDVVTSYEAAQGLLSDFVDAYWRDEYPDRATMTADEAYDFLGEETHFDFPDTCIIDCHEIVIGGAA